MIEQRFLDIIAGEVGVSPGQVAAAVALLDKGAAVSFIAWHRRDLTGPLTELQLEQIEQLNLQFISLTNRREAARTNIQSMGRMSERIAADLDACADPLELEDLYLPFKKHRHTRAGMAAQRGLEPLADFIAIQIAQPGPVAFVAEEQFVGPDKQVLSVEEALEGARSILAERFACDHGVRRLVRRHMRANGRVTASATKYAGEQRRRFEQYFGFDKPLAALEPQELLALLRGARIGVLRVELAVDDDALVREVAAALVREPGSSFDPEITGAAREAYLRLLKAEMESQVLEEARKAADDRVVLALRAQVEEALMAQPAGAVRAAAIVTERDGAMAVAVVDENGGCLEAVRIPASPGNPETGSLEAVLPELLRRHGVLWLALGNSGAGRQLSRRVSALLRERRAAAVQVNFVPEAGLSAHASSPQALQELPGLDDALIRAAVSLARRLQDPLVEMAKAEPRTLAVGPQSHDVNQRRLQEALFRTVEYCVNRVGVDLNTAPASLLRYVCGMQMGAAQNIITEREKRGGFTDRAQLKEVSGIGEKTFEQCAAFLRVTGGVQPLDATRIHPEAYAVVAQAMESAGLALSLPVESAGTLAFAGDLPPHFGPVAQAEWRQELASPWRDPRGRLRPPRKPKPAVDTSAIQEGMVVEGRITNITEFGAFVDFGMGKEGLVHLSEMAGHFVKDPKEVVETGQVVKAKVIRVDSATHRVSLSMRALLPPRENTPESGQPGQPLPSRGGERPGQRRGPDDRAPRQGGRPPRSNQDQGRTDDRGRAPRGDRETQRGGRGDRERAPRSFSDESGSLKNTLLADQLAALKDKLLSE